MATKVDTPVEPLHVQSTVSSSSPKVSKFGAKTGFVIPKNKLSGSLVPVFRGGGKVDTSNILKEESNKQAQRKTKWGVDMTQDAAVKKGRILAYQTRLEQITKQMKTGVLDFGSRQSLKSPTQSSSHDPAKSLLTEMHGDNLDQLEHEKHEVIGEILRSNPSYKAPPNYKPLLKEAKVPIPVKVYPEYNFIGLLLGSESNTQKRLEEETGAKIRVYGTNTDSKEKCEITRSDLNETRITYEELYVHVSADTYDKVDAAVALLELLVTPVSGKPAFSATPTDNINTLDSGAIFDQSQKHLASSFATITMGPISPAAVQPVATSSQTGPLQYQSYPGPWYPISSAGAPLQPLSGFRPSPLSNNSMRFPASPVKPPNMPPFFGVHPSFGSAPRNSPGVISGSQPPPQVMHQPISQPVSFQNHAVPFQKPLSPYPVMPVQPMSNTPSFPPATQLMPAGTIPPTRPALPQSLPSPMTPLGSLPNRSLTPPLPTGNSSAWPGAPLAASPQLGPNNNQVTTLQTPQKPHSFIPQSTVVTLPSQQNMPTQMLGRPPAEFFSAPAVLPLRSSFSSVPTNTGSAPVQSVTSSSISSIPTPVQPPNFMPSPAPRPWPISGPSPTPNSGLASVSASVSVQVPVTTQSASLPMAPLVPVLPLVSAQISRPVVLTPPSQPPTTGIPPVSVLKPPHPTSGDFTFQPVRTPLTSPRPNNQPAAQVTSQIPATACWAPSPQNSNQIPLAARLGPLAQSNSQMPIGLPHGPSFRPALQNPAMPLGRVGPPRHQAVNQLGQSHSPILPLSSSAVAHSSNLANFRPPPGLPHFPSSQNAASMFPLNQRGPLSFFPTPQASNIQGLTLSRPPTLMPLQKPMAPAAQSHGFLVPNQHLGKPGSGPIGNQVYDPFSPTSIRPVPPPNINEQTKPGKSENDAEYEDLMASVGVR